MEMFDDEHVIRTRMKRREGGPLGLTVNESAVSEYIKWVKEHIIPRKPHYHKCGDFRCPHKAPISSILIWDAEDRENQCLTPSDLIFSYDASNLPVEDKCGLFTPLLAVGKYHRRIAHNNNELIPFCFDILEGIVLNDASEDTEVIFHFDNKAAFEPAFDSDSDSDSDSDEKEEYDVKAIRQQANFHGPDAPSSSATFYKCPFNMPLSAMRYTNIRVKISNKPWNTKYDLIGGVIDDSRIMNRQVQLQGRVDNLVVTVINGKTRIKFI